MSSVAADVLAGIKAIVVAELGADYKELPFSLDVKENKFMAGTKGYAAYPGQVIQVPGSTGYVTVDHVFTLKLTESFGQAKVSDEAQRTAGAALMDRLERVYVKLSAQKAGVPARVLSVQRLTYPPIEFLDSNVAVLTASFEIKYRTAR